MFVSLRDSNVGVRIYIRVTLDASPLTPLLINAK